MKKLLLAAIAAAGLLGGCASDDGLIDNNLIAGNETGIWDTDRDGLFEQAEYTAFGDNNFGVWDTNDDNWIDENEFGVGWTNVGWDDDDEAFGVFDDNSDGFLDNDEFFGDDEFGVWDNDDDGVLGFDEFGF